MISYTVTANKEQIAEAISLFEFVGGNTSDAVRIAINRAAPKVRTKASSAIRTQVRLTAGYVNEKLTITKATRNNLSGAIRAESRGILLTKYSTNTQAASEKIGWILPPPNPPGGIKVKIKPSGSTQAVKGSPGEITGKPFYMVLPNSHALAIAGRKPGGGIKVFHAPSVSQVFNTVRDDVLPEAADIYQSELLDAMRYILVKQNPPE
jgi:hypothetical protein